MAGVQAGRLSIEIVAEIARLQTDLDKAKRMVGAASKDIAGSARAANDNIARMGSSSKLATHHLSNLSFQLQDIVIGLKSGQAPMTVFMQQGGQIAQIMGQAGIGIGGLIKAVGGMVINFARAHPIMLAITAAAGAIAGAFKLMAGSINENSKVTVTWGDVALGTYDAIRAFLVDKLGPTFEWLGDIASKVWKFISENAKIAGNLIIGNMVTAARFAAAAWQTFPAAVAEFFVNAANAGIFAIEEMINRGIKGLNAFAAISNILFKTKFGFLDAVDLGRIENNFKGAGERAGTAMAAATTGAFRDYIGDAVDAISPFAQARARARMEKDAETAGAAAGRKAGKAGGKAAGDVLAKEMQMSFEDAFREFDTLKALEPIWADNAKLRDTIDGLEQEAKAVGLVGWEREKLLLTLQHEAKIRPVLEQLRQAEEAHDQDRIIALRAQLELLGKIYDLQIKSGEADETWLRAADAADAYNDSLRDTIDLLQQMGGLGKTLGGLLGFLSGNFDAINGPLGALLNMTIGTRIDQKTGQTIAVKIGDELRDVFGFNGPFAATLQSILGVAGPIAAGGEFISGLINKILGKSYSKGIGSLFGAIPGLIGGLIGGSDRGAAIFGPGGVSGFYGDTKKFKDQAGDIAGGILATLQQIADQFGSDLNTGIGKVSIGIRDGKYIVDPQGRGYTKTSKYKDLVSFGTDAEAAAEYALKLMLERGAITMRAGSLKLIKEATDLQEGLEKALAFEQVFKEIEQSANPFVSALDAMKAEFDELKAIFTEAGASAAEFADLQEYFTRQQQRLVEEMMSSFRSTFYSDAENAAFARQQIAAKLGPMGLGHIDTVAEYRALVEATDAFANPELFGALMELVDAFGTLKDAEDAARESAEAAAAQRQAEIEQARNALRQAYDREATELQQTIDRFTAFGDALAEFRRELFAGEGAATSYAMRLAELRRVGRMAGLGDEGALGALPGVGRDFLTAARSQAGSLVEYQRAVALVSQYAFTAERASRGMVSEAQQQLDKLTQTVSKLIDIDEGIQTVAEAIRELVRLNGGTSSGTAPAGTTSGPSGTRTNPALSRFLSGRDQPEDRTAQSIDRLGERLERIEANTAQTAVGANQTARRLRNWDYQGQLATTTIPEAAE